MTWTKLILILVVGVVLAFILRHFVSNATGLVFYSATTPYDKTAKGGWSWDVNWNVLAFWGCLIVTFVVVTALCSRMLLRR